MSLPVGFCAQVTAAQAAVPPSVAPAVMASVVAAPAMAAQGTAAQSAERVRTALAPRNSNYLVRDVGIYMLWIIP